MTGDNFTLQNTSMKNYVNTQNGSIVNWIGGTFNTTINAIMTAQNTSQTNDMTARNTSITNSITANNASMNSYVNAQNTSVTNALATKLGLGGGTLTGNLTMAANTNITFGANNIWSNVTCLQLKGSTVTMLIC
jgi:hypothetical protein